MSEENIPALIEIEDEEHITRVPVTIVTGFLGIYCTNFPVIISA